MLCLKLFYYKNNDFVTAETYLVKILFINNMLIYPLDAAGLHVNLSVGCEKLQPYGPVAVIECAAAVLQFVFFL